MATSKQVLGEVGEKALQKIGPECSLNQTELVALIGLLKAGYRQSQEEDDAELATCIQSLQGDQIFVLSSGEIEDYLPDGYKDVAGVVELISRPGWYLELQDKEKAAELSDITCSILGVNNDVKEEFRNAIFAH